jgi:hypothetical protein
MNTGILRSVRFAFVTLLLGLTLFTVAESALGSGRTGARVAEGLSTCGTQEQPCALDPVAVVVQPAAASPASVMFARREGLAACGSEEQPCVLPSVSVDAKRGAARLASADRLPRMMVRAGS